MKILLLNGSPRKSKSNSLKLSQAFIGGIKEVLEAQVKEVTVYNKDIRDCKGCFTCWSKTPGKCVIRDDMEGLVQDLLNCDLTIISFPLYSFSLPSRLKALVDRTLPMLLPFMDPEAEYGGHPRRYDVAGKRLVLTSTCGFYTAEGNYQAVDYQFRRHIGRGIGYEKIFCG